MARDASIPINWSFKDQLLVRVAEESAKWKLGNPADHYVKFRLACELEGYRFMDKRLIELQLERAHIEQVEAQGGI